MRTFKLITWISTLAIVSVGADEAAAVSHVDSWNSLSKVVYALAAIPESSTEQRDLEQQLEKGLSKNPPQIVLHELSLFAIEQAYSAISSYVKIILNEGTAITVPSCMASAQLNVVSHHGNVVDISPSNDKTGYLFRPVEAVVAALTDVCPSCLYTTPSVWASGSNSSHRAQPVTGFEATTPLCRAAQYGFSFLVESILSATDKAVSSLSLSQEEEWALLQTRMNCPVLGTTAMHIAVSNNDTTTIDLLIESEKDVSRRFGVPLAPLQADNHGQTAYDVAEALGYVVAEGKLSEVYSVNLSDNLDAGVPKDNRNGEAGSQTSGGWLVPSEAQEYHKEVHKPGFIAERVKGVVEPSMVTDSKGSCKVTRYDVSQINAEMVRKFVDNKQPFIITGVTEGWTLPDMLARDEFSRMFSDYDFLVGRIPYGEIFGQKFGYASGSEFMQYLNGDREQHTQDATTHALENKDRLYIFDNFFVEEHPDIKGSFRLPDAIEKVFPNITRYHQFMIGPHLSGSPIHFHCHAFNVVMYGRKRWLLVPPAQSFYTVTQAYDWLHHNNAERYLQEPIPNVDKSHMEHPEVITCVQEQGELFYVPSQYGHAVLNEGENVALAIEMATNDC